MTQGLAGAVVHGDDDIGMHDGRDLRERGIVAHMLADGALVPEHQKTHVGVADQRERCRRNDDARAEIATHSIKGNCDPRPHETLNLTR